LNYIKIITISEPDVFQIFAGQFLSQTYQVTAQVTKILEKFCFVHDQD